MNILFKENIRIENNKYNAGVISHCDINTYFHNITKPSVKVIKQRKQVNSLADAIPSKNIKMTKHHIITERDCEIIDLINRFGFATAEQLASMYQVSNVRIYQRLKILCDMGLLQHVKLLQAFPGAYWPTRKGREVSGSLLTPIKAPRLVTFEHDLRVFDVYLDVMHGASKANISKWITARELAAQKISGTVSDREAFKRLKTRTPDGLILTTEGRYFAIELELSLKGSARLKGILADYASRIAAGELQGVLYYAGNDLIAEKLKAVIQNLPYAQGFRILRLKSRRSNADAERT